MLAMLNAASEKILNASGLNRFTPIVSAVYQASLTILRAGFAYLRNLEPTIDNISNAYEKSSDISHIVKTTAIHNIVYYAAPVAGVKLLFKAAPSFVAISPTVLFLCEESTLWTLAMSMLAANILYHLALTRAVAAQLPPRDDSIPNCDCGPEKKLNAGISNITLYISLVTLGSLPIPLEAALLLQTIAYGYSLAGMKYSAYEVCPTHFSPVLNNNKVYYLSLGATVVYTVNQVSSTLTSITGLQQNRHIDDAIFNIIWQQAILLAVMQAKSPDYFNHFRLAVGNLLEKKFKEYLDNTPDKGRRDYVKIFNHRLTSRLGQSLLSTTPVQLALNLHQNELKIGLKWLAWLNESTAVTIATFIIDNLPKSLTPQQAHILSGILKQQDWNKTYLLMSARLNEIEVNRELKEMNARIERIVAVEEYEQKTEAPTAASRLLSFLSKTVSNLMPAATTTGDEDYELVGETRKTR